MGPPGKAFITKIDRKGDVSWFKKITAPFAGGNGDFESIDEASNGNIFITTNSVQADNKPFFYLVFSPSGNLLYQNKFGITNNPEILGNAAVNTSLVTRFGTDSMLLVLMHPVTSGNQGMTLLTVSNDGPLGQAVTYAPPIGTTFSPYYSKCKIEGNNIFLYGGTQFYSNGCVINSFSQPAYVALKIDRSTKQVVSKKTYCSPPVGSDRFGNSLGEGTDNINTSISFQANGNIIFYRRIWGVEFNGTDTLIRIFKISVFDSSFTHIKSEYICTSRKFNWSRNWDYSLFIDSLNMRHLYVHDLPNRKVYYSVGDATGKFFPQKEISHLATRKNAEINYVSRILEPGYFTSFDIVSSDNQRSYIDNFRILANDTAAACFGTTIDFLASKPASVSPINWQGDFTVQQAVIGSAPTNFTLEDYPLQRTIVCNIVRKCDTIKLNAPDTVCNITQPVIITAHKNPLCYGKVNFTFDTAQVQSYTQLNDTTLSLIFNQSYKGRIYAQPSSCDNLIDSLQIVVIAPSSQFSLGDDTVYCPGKSYVLDAYNPNFKTYRWQDGSTDSIYLATAIGVYYVTTTDYCNRTYADTIRVIEKDFQVNLGKDSTICINESMLLSVPAGYLNYNWQPQTDIIPVNSHSVTISPRVNTSYSVEAEVFSGCKLSDSINIAVEACPLYIYFPNAFTPNNDGLNDIFKPLVEAALEKYELRIYNRWGQLVFRTTKKSEGWTGEFNGRPQDYGTFVWQCSYKFYNKPEKSIKGTVNIIR